MRRNEGGARVVRELRERRNHKASIMFQRTIVQRRVKEEQEYCAGGMFCQNSELEVRECAAHWRKLESVKPTQAS